MLEFFVALPQYPFLAIALACGLLANFGCGIMGTFVVVKRMGVIAGGISHAVLGGVGAAYFFGQSPLLGALVSAVLIAWLIGVIKLYLQEAEDTIISVLWALGMAVGVIFMAKTPGFNADLMSYLFGNILMVSRTDLIMIGVLDGAVLLCTLLFYKQFVALCFDEEYARLRGVRVDLLYLLLLTLIGITVVTLIQVVGLILVIALLTLPAAIAARFALSVKSIMILATLVGMVLTTLGMAASYTYDLPSGATIIVGCGIVYAISAMWSGVRRRHTHQSMANNRL